MTSSDHTTHRAYSGSLDQRHSTDADGDASQLPDGLLVLISGYVQGVSFRYSMMKQAEALEVAGWCRNLPNGKVEAVLQYNPQLPTPENQQRIETLLDWCHQGPPHAQVASVETSPLAVIDPPLEGFEIRQ